MFDIARNYVFKMKWIKLMISLNECTFKMNVIRAFSTKHPFKSCTFACHFDGNDRRIRWFFDFYFWQFKTCDCSFFMCVISFIHHLCQKFYIRDNYLGVVEKIETHLHTWVSSTLIWNKCCVKNAYKLL